LRHNKPDINRGRYLGIPASLTVTLGSLNGLLFQWRSVLWFGLQVRDLCGNDKTASVMSGATLEGATTMTHFTSVISWSNVVDQARCQSFCFALYKAPKDDIQAAAIAHFCQFGKTMPKNRPRYRFSSIGDALTTFLLGVRYETLHMGARSGSLLGVYGVPPASNLHYKEL
jgi:hypothetical protein